MEIFTAFETPMPLACHDGIATGITGRRGDVTVLEEGSLASDAIEGGRLGNLVISVNRNMERAPVIGDATGGGAELKIV